MTPAIAVDIRALTIDELEARAWRLLEQHYDEIARNKEVAKLDPDWGKYRAMEAGDMLLSLGAWDGDELVGYSVNFALTNIHYRKLFYVHNDVLFIAKSHRGHGRALIEQTEFHAKRIGAKLLMWHAKEGTALDLILRRREGYSVQDVTYVRTL